MGRTTSIASPSPSTTVIRTAARGARVAALAAAACVLLALVAAAAPARPARGPVLIDSYGFWPLERLGRGGDVVLHENPKTAWTQVRIRFLLPRAARQGHPNWYLIRLHFRVAVRRDAAPGEFDVSASTGGRAAASIIFNVTRHSGRPYVTSDALGLVNGVERRGGFQLVRELTFENFLVEPGVRPGRNTLMFALNQNAIPMLRFVRIFGRSSGIEVQRAGPPAVRVDAHLREPTIRVGDYFHLDVVVRHHAGLHPKRLELQVSLSNAIAVGPRTRRLPWRSGESLRTTFVFHALHAGRAQVRVVAQTNRFPADEISLYVGDSSD